MTDYTERRVLDSSDALSSDTLIFETDDSDAATESGDDATALRRPDGEDGSTAAALFEPLDTANTYVADGPDATGITGGYGMASYQYAYEMDWG